MSWRRFVRRRQWDDERREELESYLAIETDEQIARGVSPADARRAAVRKLGNPTGIREEIWHMNTLRLAEHVWQDLRLATRTLRAHPAFTTVAFLSLALGIGANTALFQLVDAVRLRSLPIHEPERLAEVRVGVANGGRTGMFTGRRSNMTTPLWERVRDDQQSFSSMGAWSTTRVDLATGGESKPAEALWVTGGFFEVVGVQPALGRLLAAADDEPGCPVPAVVISHWFWQREFGGRADVVGERVRVDGHLLPIIGVTPPSFFGLEVGRRFDLAMPVCSMPIIRPTMAAVDERMRWWLGVIGRLAPGVTIEQATAELEAKSPGIFASTVSSLLGEGDAEKYRAFRLQAFAAGRGSSGLRTSYATPLVLLLAIAGLVLLIACANLANLMFTRARAREREIAVRLAIGASRWRVFSALLSESLVLSAIGTAGGVWLAGLLQRSLVAMIAGADSAVYLDIRTDWRVFGFAAGLASLTCLLFGLLPAMRATRTPPGLAIRTGGRGLSDSRERFTLRRALVAAQVALSFVLVVGALLFARSLSRLGDVDLGFDPAPILRADLDLRPLDLPADQLIAEFDAVVERLAAVPGVRAAAFADVVPLTGSTWNDQVVVDGTAHDPLVNLNRVSPAYFDTMQIPVIAGRAFDARDTRSAPRVAVVNQVFVDQFLANGPAVGRRFRLVPAPRTPDVEYTVVGVVGDTKYTDLREAFTAQAYFATGQDPRPLPFQQVLLRSSVEPAALRGAVTAALAELDPSILLSFAEMQTEIRDSLLRERLMAALSSGFAVLALLLGATGLYGLLAYSVASRRTELGIRWALGATRGGLAALVARETAALVAVGLAVGALLAALAGRAVSALLFEMSAFDPTAFAATAGILVAVAGLAMAIPAARAARLATARVLGD